MTRRILAFALLGLAFYVVFLLAQIPAAFLAQRVAGESRGAVQVQDAAGTLWKGSATARIVPLRGSPVTLERIEWTFRPSRLIAARLAFDVRVAAAGLAGEMEAARGFGGWEARDLLVRGDAAGLAAFAPLLAALRPTGPIVLAASQLGWDGTRLQGDAMLEWQKASVAGSEVKPLGSYRANLRAGQDPAQVAITTLDGPLRITGQGTLTPPSRLTFSGEARADAAQAKALEPLLAQIGARRADGAHAIEWRF